MVFITIFHSYKNVRKMIFFQFRNILSSYSAHNFSQKSSFLAVTNPKCWNYPNFYKLLLSLPGDLNPGPFQRSPDKKLYHMGTTQQERFAFSAYKKTLNFRKKNKIRCIAKKTKFAIIGITVSKVAITVSKLYYTVTNSEVSFLGSVLQHENSALQRNWKRCFWNSFT